MSGAPVVQEGSAAAAADEFFDGKDAETVATIKELIETRVRPAVANDGGDITFRGFKDGVVYLATEPKPAPEANCPWMTPCESFATSPTPTSGSPGSTTTGSCASAFPRLSTGRERPPSRWLPSWRPSSSATPGR